MKTRFYRLLGCHSRMPDLLSPPRLAISGWAHPRGAAVEEMGDDPGLIRPKGLSFLIIADVFSENISYLQFRFLCFNGPGHRWCPPLAKAVSQRDLKG
jgi:hypothetical protein